MNFISGLEKTAISVAWALARIRGGVKSRAGVARGSKREVIIDNLTRAKSRDRKLRALPKDNLPLLKELTSLIKKGPAEKRVYVRRNIKGTSEKIRYLSGALDGERKRILS